MPSSRTKARRLENLAKANAARLEKTAPVADLSDESESDSSGTGLEDSLEFVPEASEIVTRFMLMEEEDNVPGWDPDVEDPGTGNDEEKIHDDEALRVFSDKLQSGHDAWIAEQKALHASKPKRPQFYTKNSKRSQQQHALQWHKIADKPGGSKNFITSYLKPKETKDEKKEGSGTCGFG